KPARPQASNSQPGAPLNRDDSAETMKIPDPIIEPMTIIVASIGPSARTRLVVSLGDVPPSGCTALALWRGGAPGPFSRRAASIRTSNRGLFHDTATPRRFRKSSANCVLLNVVPFRRVVFRRSQISIEVFRLPDRRIDKKRRGDPSRTNTFP